MDSQRWVSDMRSHNALNSGSEAGDTGVVDSIVDNVVPLFAPRVGSVAALIAAASGPAEPRELAGEDQIRAAFRDTWVERPRAAHRRLRLAPFAIAAGSVAGLVAGTAGLSAAAVLPPAANHIVAQVLSHVGIDVAPTSSPAAAPAPAHNSGLPVHGPKSNPSPSNGTAPSSAGPAPAAGHNPPSAPPAACAVTTAANGVIQSRAALTAAGPTSALNSSLPVAGARPCTTSPATHRAKGSGPSSGKGTKGSGPGPSKGPNKGGRHGHKGCGAITATSAPTGANCGPGTGHTGGHRGHKGSTSGSGPGTTPPVGSGPGSGPSTGPGTSTQPIGP